MESWNLPISMIFETVWLKISSVHFPHMFNRLPFELLHVIGLDFVLQESIHILHYNLAYL